jgi:hypothetical protein
MTEQKMKDDIKQAEAKDKLVLEYLDLSLEYTDQQTNSHRQQDIKPRLNEIRKILGMETI